MMLYRLSVLAFGQGPSPVHAVFHRVGKLGNLRLIYVPSRRSTSNLHSCQLTLCHLLQL